MRSLILGLLLLVIFSNQAVQAEEVPTDFKSAEINAEIKKLPEMAATLQALMEARLKVARGELIDKLKAYQTLATQDGDLDEAIKVRDAIAALEKQQSAKEQLASKEPAAKPAKMIIPRTAIKFGNSRYFLFTTPTSRAEAQRFCEERGGHLARIDTAEEHAFCAKLIQPLANNGEHRWAWIDGQAEEGKGPYFFSDGSPTTYIAWDAKKPSKLPGRRYLSLYAPTGLYYEGEGLPQPFICEWD